MQEEKEKWLYHLTVVSGGNPKQGGTQFESLLQRLMEEGGDASSPAWRHPAMLHSREAITSPLTTFTSERMQAEAVKLFKVRKQHHKKPFLIPVTTILVSCNAFL